MHVKTKDLISGCILKEDIFSMTNRPIVAKNTILTEETIEILNLFLIKSVEVDKTLMTGQSFTPPEVLLNFDQKKELTHDSSNTNSEKDFTRQFLQATQEYKENFQLWQSGLPVDISRIRLILLPLLEEMKASEIFSLHHLSNNQEYPFQHAVAVGLLCGFIANQLRYSKGDIVQAALAGILADCGMAKVGPGILVKKAALTEKEFEDIKNHPKYSYQMIQHISLLKEGMKVAVFQHHERLDGSGYPFYLKDNKIHEVAKIIAVADTFHAMTSERLYRKKQSPFKVLELMQQDYFGKFDITALKALSNGLIKLSIGSKVKLSDGQFGNVLFIPESSPTRPLIGIDGNDKIINLEENRHLYIEDIL